MSTPEKHEKTVAQAQSPIEHGALKVTAPKDSAAGVEAVFSTVKHAQREMGLISGLSLLSKLNQKDGFSCPGCAWPDPKERSSIAEYCENGAKAVAEEATRKALDAEFVRQHSVEELAGKLGASPFVKVIESFVKDDSVSVRGAEEALISVYYKEIIPSVQELWGDILSISNY